MDAYMFYQVLMFSAIAMSELWHALDAVRWFAWKMLQTYLQKIFMRSRGWMKIEQSARCLMLTFYCFLSFFPQQKNRLSNHTQSPFVVSTKSRRVLWQSIKHDYLGEPLNNSGEDMIMNDQAFADTFFSLIVGNLVLITMHRFLISWMPKLMGDQRKKSLRIQSG